MNMRIIIAATAVLMVFTTPANTKPKYHQSATIGVQCGFDRDGTSLCPGKIESRTRRHKTHTVPVVRKHDVIDTMQIDKSQEYVKPDSPFDKLVTAEEHKRGICTNNRGSTSLARVVGPLRAKAEEIVRECGAYIVSTDCRGGATPNHREGKAVDLQMPKGKSPSCIYAHLTNWPGGVSTDYWSAPGVRHVHFSYNRKHEWGLRFAHSGGSRHTKRQVAAVQYAAQSYTEDRTGTRTYATMDDVSRKGKYRSIREQRKSLALQRHATATRQTDHQ